MRLLSLTILAGILALGATTVGSSFSSKTEASHPSNTEYVAQQNGRNSTVHRGSGRRQILATTVSSIHH